MTDYYKVLGLERTASSQEIKRAYRKLSMKFHPDKNGGDVFFEKMFKEINSAYEILGNANRKIIYDGKLKRQEGAYQKNNTSYSYNRSKTSEEKKREEERARRRKEEEKKKEEREKRRKEEEEERIIREFIKEEEEKKREERRKKEQERIRKNREEYFKREEEREKRREEEERKRKKKRGRRIYEEVKKSKEERARRIREEARKEEAKREEERKRIDKKFKEWEKSLRISVELSDERRREEERRKEEEKREKEEHEKKEHFWGYKGRLRRSDFTLRTVIISFLAYVLYDLYEFYINSDVYIKYVIMSLGVFLFLIFLNQFNKRLHDMDGSNLFNFFLYGLVMVISVIGIPVFLLMIFGLHDNRGNDYGLDPRYEENWFTKFINFLINWDK